MTVVTTYPENAVYCGTQFYFTMIKQMQEASSNGMIKDEVTEHSALIDKEIVWHGGKNLLGYEGLGISLNLY